jgi:hypothetical protein
MSLELGKASMCLARSGLALAAGACIVACSGAGDSTEFYCSPYLGLVTASALSQMSAAARNETFVCPSGTSCVAGAPAGVVCGEQPDGSVAGDACPSFMCSVPDGG